MRVEDVLYTCDSQHRCLMASPLFPSLGATEWEVNSLPRASQFAAIRLIHLLVARVRSILRGSNRTINVELLALYHAV